MKRVQSMKSSSRLIKERHFILLLLLLVLFLVACSHRSEEQPREPETSGSLRTSESTATQAEERVPTVTEVEAMLALQERILRQPQDVALRRALGQKAIGASGGVVWSIGRGKISPTAASPNIAQSQAELAARIDASRWAAYLIAWQQNDYATNFGELHGNAPNGEIVSTAIVDSMCVVVMKTSLR